MNNMPSLLKLLSSAENRAYVAACVVWYVIDAKFDAALGPPAPPYSVYYRDMDILAGYAMEIARLG